MRKKRKENRNGWSTNYDSLESLVVVQLSSRVQVKCDRALSTLYVYRTMVEYTPCKYTYKALTS